MFLVIFAIIVSLLLYIHAHNLASASHPKSMHQFAKDFYQRKEGLAAKNSEFQARNYCQTIHIGVVCSGYSSNAFFHLLLKTLFLHRVNPIHFHLLVNDESEKVLKLLFKTWQVPQVTTSYYNVKDWVKKVRWVPNQHYSGNFGLLKLKFPTIVPLNVTTKLLVLDTDLIFNGDVYLLWKLFEDFNYKQVLAIGDNQSRHYLGKLNKQHPWPAIGIGFNSGVMLYDLERMNKIEWDTMWVNLTKRLTTIYGQVHLGDQDIINALLVENPDIFYHLPCFWNTQMSVFSISEDCYKEHKPMIIHWNSPKKFDVITKDSEKFRGLLNMALELNGNWFRNLPQMCNYGSRVEFAMTSNNSCQKFTRPYDMPYRTLLFFRNYKYIPEDVDVTYVTHLSIDRADLMEDIAKTWTGPICFTLYATDAELITANQKILKSDILRDRTDISYHVVFKEDVFYPTNTLRNIGLRNVNTPYVFMVDIDFLPMKSLYEILTDNIRSMGDLQKRALVVPAFEVTNSKVRMPKNKIQLIEFLNEDKVKPFLEKVWTAGHGPTDYRKWREELEPYQVQWKPNYEPYIVAKTNIPRYDERFLGFGWNKVSHIMELEALNYEFIVLSDVFIVHQPHRISCDNMMYKKSPVYRRCLQNLKKRFVERLQKKYNKTYVDMDYDTDAFDVYKRRKRDVRGDVTTTLYDSTDYFLVWGGKEKAERKMEPKKSFAKVIQEDASPEGDYFYYESEFPYNLTVFKMKHNKTRFGKVIKPLSRPSSEEHDYEYDEDDNKFKVLHDTTTLPYFHNTTNNEEFDSDKFYNSAQISDEKTKNISFV